MVTSIPALSIVLRSSAALLPVLTVCATLIVVTSPTKSAAAGIDDTRPRVSDEFSSVHRGGGGGRVHAGGHGRPAHVNRPVNRPGHVNRPVNRPAHVHRPANRPGYAHRPGGGNIIVNRPIRGWAYRPYFGTVVGGIALGSVIAATTAGVAPAAPGPNMCWYWTDPARINGYWDYCQPPY